jgi:hypothetical protein
LVVKPCRQNHKFRIIQLGTLDHHDEKKAIVFSKSKFKVIAPLTRKALKAGSRLNCYLQDHTIWITIFNRGGTLLFFRFKGGSIRIQIEPLISGSYNFLHLITVRKIFCCLSRLIALVSRKYCRQDRNQASGSYNLITMM